MTKWPERFVYVCTPSKGAAVNAAPLVQAGFSRIARVEFLLGESGATSDAGQSKAPHGDLERAIKLMAKSRGIPVPALRSHVGEPHDPNWWSTILSDICERAEGDSLSVVFNLTGGTKMMSIGGMLGCMGADALRAELLHVDSNVRPHVIKRGDRSLLPIEQELSIQEYLTAYGVACLNVEASRQRKAFYTRHLSALAKFANCLLDDRQNVRTLNAHGEAFLAGAKVFRGPKFIPWPGGARPALRDALRDLAPSLSVTVSDDGVRVEDAFSFSIIFQGGWLEAALFNHVAKRIGNQPGFEIDANLQLREDGDTKILTELDVAIMARSRLYVIEAKSGHERDVGKWLQQVETMRNRIVGPYSEAYVFNVRGSESTRQEWEIRTNRLNIHLLMGETVPLLDELEAVIQQIKNGGEAS